MKNTSIITVLLSALISTSGFAGPGDSLADPLEGIYAHCAVTHSGKAAHFNLVLDRSSRAFGGVEKVHVPGTRIEVALQAKQPEGASALSVNPYVAVAVEFGGKPFSYAELREEADIYGKTVAYTPQGAVQIECNIND